MRIVVQHPKTGCYLEETGGWTNDVRAARDFLSSADAISTRRQLRVDEASLVFRFEREGYAITVPLEPLQPLAFDSGSTPRHPADLLIG